MKYALAALVLATSTAAASVAAQGSGVAVGPWAPTRGAEIKPNVEYTGQFTFVRLRYGAPIPYQSQRVPWSHDYPFGEQHFMKIMNEVTNLKPRTMESNVMGLDDPELSHFPVAYMSEPGYMFLTESEVAGLRSYLLKGGFVIFDDFAEERGGWAPFEYQMNRVIPGARWYELDGTHPVFHAFFEIPDPLKFLPPYEEQEPPRYMGLYENNDPSRRLIAIVNFNNDISEYWESGQGFAPVPAENEAYKLGVNYVIYGLTH